ncbi:MAG: 23S rRNA (pseudouridine(1915)-N(3))-methyltransferase RlmH, partial [Pikeienuella sp.]
MRIAILAIGRQKGGPEAALVADYLKRFDAAGRAMGLGPARLQEIEDKKRAGESRRLREALPQGAVAVALDERGEALTSPDLAPRVAPEP